jgi:hypothetical protein
MLNFNSFVNEQLGDLNVGDYAIYNGNFNHLEKGIVKIIDEVPLPYRGYQHGPRRFKVCFIDNEEPFCHIVGEKLLLKAPKETIEKYKRKLEEFEIKRLRWMEEHPEDPYGEEVWESVEEESDIDPYSEENWDEREDKKLKDIINDYMNDYKPEENWLF